MVSEVGAVTLAVARGSGGIGEGGLGLPSDGAGLEVNGIRQRGRRRRRRPVLTPTRGVQVSVKGREAPPVQAADRLADPRRSAAVTPSNEIDLTLVHVHPRLDEFIWACPLTDNYMITYDHIAKGHCKTNKCDFVVE